jgi:transposase
MKTEGLHVVRPRAAGLDVHKMEITATVRLCEGEGEPVVETRCFSTLPSGLEEMVAWLTGHGVEAAVMEGTGIYWQAPFAAVEAAGVEAVLVHARQVKQLKGRKTDVADSVWLACVCQFGLCTPSHVPPEPFRELRSLSRQRRVLVRQRSTVRNRVQKIIDRAGVRIGGILSDVFGVNGRKILDGLAQGTGREAILASLTRHVADKLEGLGEALSLSLGDNDRFMLGDLLGEHDALVARIASYTEKLDEQMTPWEEQLRLLTTIPGIDRTAASTILIEVGPEIEVFASKEHFAAWAGLCPGNNESGGKRRNARTRRGSKTLRACLVECAHGAARTRGCQFEAHHRALAARRGYKRAIVASAHKMLRIIYVVLKTGRPYYDRTADYDALMVKRNAPRWIRMLRRYGYIEPVDAELKAA